MTPRGLSIKEAAEYAGCKTVAAYRDRVRRGVLPGPIPGTHSYDRRAIDAALARFKLIIPQVYVVGFGAYVKIGWSADVRSRIADLEMALPEALTVYSLFDGTKHEEFILHRRFAELRTRGEWFRREGELADWITRGCPQP